LCDCQRLSIATRSITMETANEGCLDEFDMGEC
jgi:hypothetical protein